jgi:NADH-quinone oxidoreductase subunit N
MRLLIEPFAALAADWTQVIIALSILTMAVGAYMAIVQQNLKRLLAYSSIGHVGFMLVGLVGGTIQGVHAVLMYLTIYGIMTMGAFGMLMLLRRKDVYLETIDDIAGLSEKAPAYAFMLLVLFFSIAGIPPLAGFFAKFYVFGAAVAAGYTWLAIVAVVLSVVSAFYVLRVIRAMYFDKGLNKPIDMNAPMPMRMAVVAAVLFVVGFIFFMQPIDAISYKAAESLFVSASL